MKKCTYCQIEKDLSQFGARSRKLKNGTTKMYPSIYCKECTALKIQLWRAINPDKVKEQNASPNHRKAVDQWMETHQEERKAYEQRYYKEHPEVQKRYRQSAKGKATKRQYKKKRKQTDPIFRLRENVSNAILKALKKGKSNKAGQSMLQYLNYTIQDLKEHIEKQFDENMSWANYGIYWHIDHITPQSDLPYSSMKDENFKTCWALDNLRPLEAKQNILDGATRARHKNRKSK